MLWFNLVHFRLNNVKSIRCIFAGKCCCQYQHSSKFGWFFMILNRLSCFIGFAARQRVIESETATLNQSSTFACSSIHCSFYSSISIFPALAVRISFACVETDWLKTIATGQHLMKSIFLCNKQILLFVVCFFFLHIGVAYVQSKNMCTNKAEKKPNWISIKINCTRIVIVSNDVQPPNINKFTRDTSFWCA